MKTVTHEIAELELEKIALHSILAKTLGVWSILITVAIGSVVYLAVTGWSGVLPVIISAALLSMSTSSLRKTWLKLEDTEDRLYFLRIRSLNRHE